MKAHVDVTPSDGESDEEFSYSEEERHLILTSWEEAIRPDVKWDALVQLTRTERDHIATEAMIDGILLAVKCSSVSYNLAHPHQPFPPKDIMRNLLLQQMRTDPSVILRINYKFGANRVKMLQSLYAILQSLMKGSTRSPNDTGNTVERYLKAKELDSGNSHSSKKREALVHWDQKSVSPSQKDWKGFWLSPEDFCQAEGEISVGWIQNALRYGGAFTGTLFEVAYLLQAGQLPDKLAIFVSTEDDIGNDLARAIEQETPILTEAADLIRKSRVYTLHVEDKRGRTFAMRGFLVQLGRWPLKVITPQPHIPDPSRSPPHIVCYAHLQVHNWTTAMINTFNHQHTDKRVFLTEVITKVTKDSLHEAGLSSDSITVIEIKESSNKGNIPYWGGCEQFMCIKVGGELDVMLHLYACQLRFNHVFCLRLPERNELIKILVGWPEAQATAIEAAAHDIRLFFRESHPASSHPTLALAIAVEVGARGICLRTRGIGLLVPTSESGLVDLAMLATGHRDPPRRAFVCTPPPRGMSPKAFEALLHRTAVWTFSMEVYSSVIILFSEDDLPSELAGGVLVQGTTTNVVSLELFIQANPSFQFKEGSTTDHVAAEFSIRPPAGAEEVSRRWQRSSSSAPTPKATAQNRAAPPRPMSSAQFADAAASAYGTRQYPSSPQKPLSASSAAAAAYAAKRAESASKKRNQASPY